MKFEIVPASEATMAEVEAWLDAEENAHVAANAAWERKDYSVDIPPRGFRCNWDETKQRWREDQGGVDVLIVDGEAVGFQGLGLFEIRPDLRRRGYGRILADFMITTSFEEGSTVIEIGISPPTAKPFWESMGFTLVPGKQHYGAGAYAYKVLARRFPLAAGERVPFDISFYSADERYSDKGRPFGTFDGLAERLSRGSLQLPERAFCFDPAAKRLNDPFVRIEVNGEELLFEKVKYDTNEAFGIERDKDGIYFLDRIRIDAHRA